MSTCAFIGLGNMGYPMAGHLASAGHVVRVYNRTTATATKWSEEHEGTAHGSPAEASNGADVVFLCLGDDDSVRSIVTGSDGVLSALSPGASLVDHTTASADLARELYQSCSDAGVAFVDAPISGGQAGAENGQLAIMCGGDQQAFDSVSPIMDAYAKTMVLVGGPGSGQQTKMVNQILCAGAIHGAAEALAFGEQAGLDMSKVLDVVTQGAAGSWYLSNRGETMLADEFDFGFAVDWLFKDLGLVRAEAQSIGAPTPLTELTTGYLSQAQAAGENRLDATAIIRRYRDQRSD